LFSCNPPATTAIYTHSLHDALPIFWLPPLRRQGEGPKQKLAAEAARTSTRRVASPPIDTASAAHARQSRLHDATRRPEPTCTPSDRKSTRLNSSHVKMSYAVFCLKR